MSDRMPNGEFPMDSLAHFASKTSGFAFGLLALLATEAVGHEPIHFNAVGRSEMSFGTLQGCGDIWGEGDTVVVALRDVGFTMIDVSNPDEPERIGSWNPGNVFVQDVKYSNGYVVASNESYNGTAVYILDASDPSDIRVVSTIGEPEMESCHNVWVDERGYLYASKTSPYNAVRIYDLSNPSAPRLAHEYQHPRRWAGIHDVVALDGIMYAGFLSSGFVLVDVSDPDNPVDILRKDYSGSFCHNIWPTADGNHVLTTDEVVGGHVKIWDVSDPGDVQQVAMYQSHPQSIVHNVHVKGDLAYISYYEEGLRVIDVSDPTAPVEVAIFDTWLPETVGAFRGNWGVWPYQRADNPAGESELVFLSHLDSRVEIVELNGPRRAGVDGTLQRPSGDPLPVGDVLHVESGRIFEAGEDGSFTIETGSGTSTLRGRGFGYADEDTPVELEPNEFRELDLRLTQASDAEIILVADDEGGAAADSVEAWLDELALSSDRWDTSRKGPFRPNRLFGFNNDPVMIWVTGSEEDQPLSDAELDSLSMAMTGASVSTLLSGQYIGDYLAGNEWLSEHFGATHDVDRIEERNVFGIAGDPLSDGMHLELNTVDGPVMQRSPGSLIPDESARPLLHYDGQPNTYAGVFDLHGDHQTLFLEFGIEGINRRADRTTPEDFLAACIRELQNPTGFGSDQPTGAPAAPVAALAQNAPNPFNPRTVIRFQIDVASSAELAIFDSAGRRVRTLVAEELPAGVHSISWDGTDDSGRVQPSGRYLYRLTSGDHSVTRSMVLVK